MNYDILIMGSGSVCETTCRAIALTSTTPLRVAVLGRSLERVQIVTALANAMAGAVSNPVHFTADTIDWDHESDLPEKMEKYHSHIVFQTASLQSPWELLGKVKETPWKKLLWDAGNAVVVPLQIALVKRVATIAKAMSPSPIVVNACFPDHVNPILKYLDLPITSGIGNVAMFAGVMRARNPQPEHKVQIVGHLYHYFKILGKTHDPKLDGPRVWIDGEEILDVETTLADAFHDLRSVNAQGKLINELVGTNCSELLQALLGDTLVATHVPGPNGLPGGYPVIVGNGKVELDLPEICSLEEALAVNKQGAYDMGTAVIDKNGFSAYSTTASALLEQHIPALAKGFQIADLDDICIDLLALRKSMGGE